MKLENGAKWMTVIKQEQKDWIVDTAEKTNLTGSEILRELIDRAMAEDQKKFRASLTNIHLKLKLQGINDRKAALLEEERELRRQLSEEKVVA